MKRKFMSLLAIFFPWAVFLIEDNPGAFVVAIVMQATLIGWIPASMWAWRLVHGEEKKNAVKNP